MPTPSIYRTPEHRAAVKAARSDPDHPKRHLDALRATLEWYAAFPGKPRPGWAYTSLQALILDQGRPYTAAPRPKGLRKMTNRLCFRNALHTAWWHRDLRYVEGYALSHNGIPTEHAWCVTPEGVVVDPTWYEPDLAAYIGVEIPMTVVGQSISRHHVFGVLVNDWRNDFQILRTGQIELGEEEQAS